MSLKLVPDHMLQTPEERLRAAKQGIRDHIAECNQRISEDEREIKEWGSDPMAVGMLGKERAFRDGLERALKHLEDMGL